MNQVTLTSSLGLRRNPFPPTPDALSYFFTQHLQREYAEVRHCIEARKGLVVVTGEVGLGKSTLVRRLLDDLGTEQTASALIFNTFLQEGALLNAILRDFGLAVEEGIDAGLAALNDFLIAQAKADRLCVLVVDDAQNLSEASLELVRLLSNLETGQEKLLQILLSGQPELLEILQRKSMRQIHSRIVKHATLVGLVADEVPRYFEFRITAAGGDGHIALDAGAAQALYRGTQGNLRRIHLVLDRCLYGLSALHKSTIDANLVRAALRDVSMPDANLLPIPFGRQTLPVNRRMLALALAALALLLGAGIYMLNGRSAALAAVLLPISKSEPVAGARKIAPLPNSPRAICFERLTARWPGLPVTLRVLPVKLHGVVQDASRTCVFEERDERWIAWVSAPTAADAFTFFRQSEATRQFQLRLAGFGLLAKADVHGYFGARTQQALRDFQVASDIPVNGVPDEFTLMLLENINAIPARNSASR